MVKRERVKSEIAIDWKAIDALGIKAPEELIIGKDVLKYRRKEGFSYEIGTEQYMCSSVKEFVAAAREVFKEVKKAFDGIPVKKVSIGSSTRGRETIIQVILKNGNKYDITDFWIRKNTRTYLKKFDGEITIEEFARIIKESESGKQV